MGIEEFKQLDSIASKSESGSTSDFESSHFGPKAHTYFIFLHGGTSGLDSALFIYIFRTRIATSTSLELSLCSNEQM